MHDLAADVHPAMVVRRDGDGERPIPAVPHVRGAPSVGRLRPHPHVAGVAGAHVVDLELAVVAPRPDRRVVHGVGDAEAALAAADRLPQPLREAASETVARHPVGAVILAVAVEEVGDLRIREHVVHLRDRQHHAGVALAAVQGHAGPAVVGDQVAVGVQRVHPDVVVVAARPEPRARQRRAAVQRHAEAHRDEVQPVGIVRRHGEAHVIRRALGHVVVAAHEPPGGARVVGAVQRRVRVLHQRVHPVRVGRGDRHRDLSHGVIRLGEPVARQALPRRAAVARHPQPAARPAAFQVPRLDLELPHRGEQDVRVPGVHREVGAAGVRVHRQYAVPRFAPVGRAIHAAVR